jgi:hypothetical protein
LVVLALVSGWIGVPPAGAQVRGESEPRGEAGVSAMVLGVMPLGEASADLQRPRGTSLDVFHTDSRVAPALGIEGHVGRAITRRLSIEGAGGWTPAPFETRADSDLEGADAATLRQRTSRFTVEGAVLWSFVRRDRLALFVRGSGGWLREVTRGVGLVEDGQVGSAGLGVKYWWGSDRARRRGRVALRVEGRALARSGGLLLGAPAIRIAPAATAGFSVGF